MIYNREWKWFTIETKMNQFSWRIFLLSSENLLKQISLINNFSDDNKQVLTVNIIIYRK